MVLITTTLESSEFKLRVLRNGERTESKLMNCLSRYPLKTTPDVLEIKWKRAEWEYEESLLKLLQFKEKEKIKYSLG